MKIVTASNGKQTIKMSKKEWENIGKMAGWVDKVVDKTIGLVPQKDQPIRNRMRGVSEEAPKGNQYPKPSSCPDCGAAGERIFWDNKNKKWKCYTCGKDSGF